MHLSHLNQQKLWGSCLGHPCRGAVARSREREGNVTQCRFPHASHPAPTHTEWPSRYRMVVPPIKHHHSEDVYTYMTELDGRI